MPDATELRSIIPGWGADLDFRDRPAVPMEKAPPNGTGAHWDEPERQIPRVKILKSPEHQALTATFGTACPPRLLSGKIREFAYTFSEARKAHWMLLLFADRVDMIESALESLLTGRAHNPLSEMGLASELKDGAFRTRFGENRSDVRRQKRELLLVLGLGAGVALVAQAARRKAA